MFRFNLLIILAALYLTRTYENPFFETVPDYIMYLRTILLFILIVILSLLIGIKCLQCSKRYIIMDFRTVFSWQESNQCLSCLERKEKRLEGDELTIFGKVMSYVFEYFWFVLFLLVVLRSIFETYKFFISVVANYVFSIA